ncbi:MAG TPA: segregation/condensation protein A [Candidatus Nanoarchaeia archaeon]|nr:segregation/condensation protein A [Candidatus Nanoarchaeia archaeon]
MEEIKTSVKQEQIHDLLFSREIGWQEIIYDLINTEQLNPWDIDITILTEGYLKKISELEEADFFVSSKVLLAASFLLRIKSEILLNKYIKSIDEILFGKKESTYHKLERIELDEELPELIPRSPIPRFKKVTLQELISALNQAIHTENRRIKKEIINRNALRESEISLPKRRFSIKDKIKQLYTKLVLHFNDNKESTKITYSEFIGTDRENRILSFAPLLHLDNQKKVWLAQTNHFDEIDIWLKHIFLKHNSDPIEELRKELEAELRELDSKKRKRIQKINKDFENPLGEELNN